MCLCVYLLPGATGKRLFDRKLQVYRARRFSRPLDIRTCVVSHFSFPVLSPLSTPEATCHAYGDGSLPVRSHLRPLKLPPWIENWLFWCLVSHSVMEFCSHCSAVPLVGVFESGSLLFRGNPSCACPPAVDAFLIAGLSLLFRAHCPHRCVRVYNQLYHSDSPEPLGNDIGAGG